MSRGAWALLLLAAAAVAAADATGASCPIDGDGRPVTELDDADAPSWIHAAVARERDREVREQGVFALSQVDGGVTHLVRLLRESEHADVKRQALFWLGQSDDPKALDELERLLER